MSKQKEGERERGKGGGIKSRETVPDLCTVKKKEGYGDMLG